MNNSELAERIFFELEGLGIDNPHIQKELHAAVVILKKEIAAAELLAKMRPAPIDVEDLKAQLAAATKRADEARAVAIEEAALAATSSGSVNWAWRDAEETAATRIRALAASPK